MFPGSCFGVAVTVAELVPFDPTAPPLGPAAAPPRPIRLHKVLPADDMTDEELAREIQASQRVESLMAAYRAERVAQLAARRPATEDWRRTSSGSDVERETSFETGVSEFFPDELAMIMGRSRTAATVLTDTATTLLTRLPATWDALTAGELDWPRARVLAAELGWPARDTDPAIVRAVEAAVLSRAAEMPVRGLQAAVRRELLSRDAAAAGLHRRQADRGTDVVGRSAADGMGELSIYCPAPLSAAIGDALDHYARLARDAGDPRTLGQLRVAMLGELVLRPWDTTRPPVTAALTVTAPLSAMQVPRLGDGVVGPQPTGDVDGQPITASALRTLLEEFDAVCPGGLQAPTGGSLTIAITDPVSGALRAAVSRPELERLAARGCASHPDGECSCPLLDRPPPVDRYRPSAAQRRFVTTRDRTCRHPGCRNRAAWADLDHVLPHAAGGATDCANLCCLCRRHHRLKTHAPGWAFRLEPDGTLTVTTPTGITRTTRPPGLAPPGELDPAPFRSWEGKRTVAGRVAVGVTDFGRHP